MEKRASERRTSAKSPFTSREASNRSIQKLPTFSADMVIDRMFLSEIDEDAATTTTMAAINAIREVLMVSIFMTNTAETRYKADFDPRSRVRSELSPTVAALI